MGELHWPLTLRPTGAGCLLPAGYCAVGAICNGANKKAAYFAGAVPLA